MPVRPRVLLHEVAHQGEQLQSQKSEGHAHTKNSITLRACTTSSAPDQYFNSLRARPFTKPLYWILILHCCCALLQNLVRNSGATQCLEEAEQQTEASVDVPYPPLQIVNSVPFCLFSLYLYPPSAPFLSPLSSPSPPSFFLF